MKTLCFAIGPKGVQKKHLRIMCFTCALLGYINSKKEFSGSNRKFP